VILGYQDGHGTEGVVTGLISEWIGMGVEYFFANNWLRHILEGKITALPVQVTRVDVFHGEEGEDFRRLISISRGADSHSP